jgi:HAD superfamily hydrolase (TIGR01509 family)
LEERERISFEKESGYRAFFLPELKLVAGLQQLLETAFQAGIPMGIGTAAPKANVDFVLDNLQIRHYFQAIVDANDVDKGKPDPGVFFKVADMLGAPYQRCLVFEDSPTGARTALNAGMKAIILTTTHQAHEFENIASVLRCMPDYTRIDILSTLENLNQP